MGVEFWAMILILIAIWWFSPPKQQPENNPVVTDEESWHIKDDWVVVNENKLSLNASPRSFYAFIGSVHQKSIMWEGDAVIICNQKIQFPNEDQAFRFINQVLDHMNTLDSSQQDGQKEAGP